MITALYPTVVDTQGRPIHRSLFPFSASESLEELKVLAQSRAVLEADRQYIVQYTQETYVVFSSYWKESVYFRGKSPVARFSANGRETTRKATMRGGSV